MATAQPDKRVESSRSPFVARSASFGVIFASIAALGGGCASSPAASGSNTDGSVVIDAHGAVDAKQSDASHADSSHGDARENRPETGAESGPESGSAHDSGSGHANGTLGMWQTLAPMPLPRANHCAAVAAGYLVVIGGNYATDGSFADTAEVDVALLHADGSLGAWSQAGSAPSAVSGCTVASSGPVIYLVDGIYDTMADQGHAFSAELSAAGKLGQWTPLGPLPNGQDAFYSQAWVSGGATATLYAMDSSFTATAALTVPTAPNFGTWSEDDWLPGFLGRPEFAFTGAYVYAMGGYLSTDAGNPSVTTVSGAPIAADGTVGIPFTTEPLPMPITYGNGVAVDDWIFVIGGKPSPFDTGEPNTLSSQIGAAGELGPWTAQTSLPEGRTDMALTLAGDFLYLTGGGYMGPGVATVFAARVRF